MNNKIKITNTKDYLENDFWVCIFHANPVYLFNNSIDKERKIKSLLDVGEICINGVFPKFLVNDNQRSLIIGEYYLEKERLAHFPDYPSRCSSFYVFPNKNEMEKAITTHGWKYFRIFNVRINTDKPFKVLKANMEIVSSIRSGNPNQIPLSDYWNCNLYDINYSKGISYPPILELIIEGEVLVK